MISDPITITVNSVDKTLVRINQDGYSSEYLLREADEEFRLRFRNTTYRDKSRNVLMDRHNVELIHTVFPVAPATLSTIRKSYFVMENQQGDTLTDPVYIANALAAELIASSNALLNKLTNFES